MKWAWNMVLAAAALGVSAGVQAGGSDAFRACMDRVDLAAFKNSQRSECAAQEIRRQDVILNAEYNKVRLAMAPEQKALMVRAQRAWLEFRKAWCQLETTSSAAPGGELNGQLCMIELTDRQIDAIKALQ